MIVNHSGKPFVMDRCHGEKNKKEWSVNVNIMRLWNGQKISFYGNSTGNNWFCTCVCLRKPLVYGQPPKILIWISFTSFIVPNQDYRYLNHFLIWAVQSQMGFYSTQNPCDSPINKKTHCNSGSIEDFKTGFSQFTLFMNFWWVSMKKKMKYTQVGFYNTFRLHNKTKVINLV